MARRGRSVRKGLAYGLGGNFGFFAIQFASSVIVARLLTPSEMGVYAASMAIVYVISGLLQVGLGGYILRERELGPDKIGTVAALTLVKAALFGGVLFALSFPIGAFTRDERVTHSLQILTLYAAFMPFLGPLSALRNREMRFGLSTFIALLNILVSAVVTVALAYLDYGYTAMAWGNGAGTVVAVLLSLALQRREIMVPLVFTHAREIMRFGTRIFLTAFVVNVSSRSIDIILTRVAGAAATGLYNRGAGMVDVFGNTLLRSFQRVQASKMRRDRDSRHGIGPGYKAMKRVITGVFWPGFTVAAIMGSPLIGLLYGRQWLAAAPIFALICLATIISLIVQGRQTVYVTLGREKELPRNELIRGLIGVGMFSVGVQFGLVWAAFTRVLDACVSVLLYMPGLKQGTGLGYRAVARELWPSLVITVATAAPALAYMLWAGWPPTLHVEQVAAVFGACALAWLGAIYALDHLLAKEITMLAGNIRRRLAR